MNLTSSAESIKKIVKFLFVLFLIITLAILAYLKLFNVQKPLPVLENISIQVLPQEVTSISSNNLKTQNNQSSLPAYKIVGQENLLQKSNMLADKLNLKNAKFIKIKDASYGDGESYANSEASLAIYSQLLTYQKVGTKPKRGSFDAEKLKIISLQTLENLELNSNLGNPEVSYQSIEKESIQKASGPEVADLINLVYNYKIDAIPVVGPLSAPNISLTSDGSLFGLRYTPLPQFARQEKYPLISPKDAVALIEKQKFAAIKITPFTDTIASTKQFTSVILKNAYLAYYVSPTQTSIQPVWVLEGNAQISGATVEVQFAAPAINPKYLNAPKLP